MSRANIVETVVIPETGITLITFESRNGDQFTYAYGPAEAKAIEYGADPKDVDGERVASYEKG